jgi:hypothetical protein
VARTADGQAAFQHVALGDPKRATLSAQGVYDRLEDPRQELVEVEAGVEVVADRLQQTEALYLTAKRLSRRRRGSACYILQR